MARNRALSAIAAHIHVQAYERRFGPISSETLRELNAALNAIHGDRRHKLHTFRELMRAVTSSNLHASHDIPAIAEKLQHSTG